MTKTLEEVKVLGKSIYNNIYEYLEIIRDGKGYKAKLKIKCKIHGEFIKDMNDHLKRNQGCSKCSKHCKLTNEDFIEKSISVHGNFYDYSKIVYKNYESKVIIICKEHGEFLQTPLNHLQGNTFFSTNT